MIVGPILGNLAAIFWFNLTGCGLVGPASPGSIIAYLMMAPGDKIIQIIVGVVIATAISFVVSSAIVRMAKGKSLEEAQESAACQVKPEDCRQISKNRPNNHQGIHQNIGEIYFMDTA